MHAIPEFVDALDSRSKLNNVRGIIWNRQMFPGTFRERKLPHLFMEHFDESHCSGILAPPKNPFIGRYLRICIRSTSAQYVEGLTDTMKIFGKNIWYLEVRIENMKSAPRNLFLYRNLRTWLDHAPNLRFLHISSNYPISKISNEDNSTTKVCFPKLEKLEVLFMQNMGTQIGSELIRKNSHITYLKI